MRTALHLLSLTLLPPLILSTSPPYSYSYDYPEGTLKPACGPDFDSNDPAENACDCYPRGTCTGPSDKNYLYKDSDPKSIDYNPFCKSIIIDCSNKGLDYAPSLPSSGVMTGIEQYQMDGKQYTREYVIGKVWLDGNNFEEIPTGYFDSVKSHLVDVHMHNNPNLEVMGDMLFSNMPRLDTVLGHFCNLQSLGGYLFNASTAIRRIWMNNNEISVFHSEAFHGIGKNLKELLLYDNNITDIPVDAFEGLTGLKDLRLNGNPIPPTTFPCSLLCPLPTTADVQIFDSTNPLFEAFMSSTEGGGDKTNMVCGPGCDASKGGIGVYDPTVDSCDYQECNIWDLSGAGHLNFGWVTVAAVLGAGLAMI